jgi:anti-sigma B factor antagonist
MRFKITQEERGRTCLLRIHGELDIATAPTLKDFVLVALQNGAHSLAFDFTELKFLDSSGLAVLLGARKRAAERGGEVYILGAARPILDLFTLMNLVFSFRFCQEADLPGV